MGHMLIKSDNYVAPSLWLWALGFAYRTIHGILVIGLTCLTLIGLFWGIIYFLVYPHLAGTGPAGMGSDTQNFTK